MFNVLRAEFLVT